MQKAYLAAFRSAVKRAYKSAVSKLPQKARTGEIPLKIRKKFEKLSGLVKSKVAVAFAEYFVSRLPDVFTGQGIRDGEGREWAARTPYMYLGSVLSARPALIRTGALKDGFYYEEDSGIIRILNREPHFIYHQSSKARSSRPHGTWVNAQGRKRKGGLLPRRPMLFVTDADKKVLEAMIRKELKEASNTLSEEQGIKPRKRK